MKTTVTSKDIAKQVGISPSTVCAVLSNTRSNTRVSKATRERIEEAATRMGYRPNVMARATRRGRFNAVGLLMSTVDGRSTLPSDLLDHLHDALARRGFQLSVHRLPDSELTDQAKIPRILREFSVDGLLVNYTDHIPETLIELIRRHQVPSVWLNAKLEADCVYPDDFDASYQLTRRLIAAGRRRIAYVDLSHDAEKLSELHYSAADRYGGYQAAMKEAGLTPDWPRLFDGKTVLGGREEPERIKAIKIAALRGYLERADRPEAIVAYSSLHAQHLAFLAASHGLAMPDRLVVASFGSMDDFSCMPIELPAALPPLRELAETAIDMLAAKIQNPRDVRAPAPMRFEIYDGTL